MNTACVHPVRAHERESTGSTSAGARPETGRPSHRYMAPAPRTEPLPFVRSDTSSTNGPCVSYSWARGPTGILLIARCIPARYDGAPARSAVAIWTVREVEKKTQYEEAVVRLPVKRKRRERSLRVSRDRVRRQNRALVRLASSDVLTSGDLPAATALLAETACETLSAESTEAWLLNSQRTEIRCVARYDRADRLHTSGEPEPTGKHQAMLRTLAGSRVLVSVAERTDSGSRGLLAAEEPAPYAGAAMAAPARLDGRLIGYVKFQHSGGERKWAYDEQNFAASLGDLAALAAESQRRRQAEEALREAQKLEIVQATAAGLAHDLRNLAGAIMFQAEAAGRSAEGAGPAQAALEKIRAAAEQTAALSEGLLALATPQDSSLEPVELNALVLDGLRLLQSPLGPRTTLELDLEPDLPEIEADPTQILQAVLNLTMNAADAIGERAGRVIVRTRRRETESPAGLPPGRYVTLEVEDDGPGVAPETLSRIFEPSFTTRPEGRGLGLAVVLQIVRSHSGGVSMKSEQGAGTTITLFFPAIRPEGR